jgi:hypothetical protein
MIFNFAKPETIISIEMMKCFLSLFNSRSKRICSCHKEVNERKDNYQKLNGSVCFAGSDDMITELSSLFSGGQPVHNRLYFLKKFNSNHVLFLVNFFEGKIFYIDPKQSDRALVPENLQDFFNQTKEEITSACLSAHPSQVSYSFSQLSVEIYPHQYYDYDESDLSSYFYTILVVYFLETGVPIWFTNKVLKETMKTNFSYWLLTGNLPF